MNIDLILIALRAAALGITLSSNASPRPAGTTRRGDQLYQLADLIEAGQLSDAHMKEVAEKLKDRSATDVDFDDVLARIAAHRKDLHQD